MEYVSELVRAHYEGQQDRFDVIVRQLAASEDMHGRPEVAERLRSIQQDAKALPGPRGPAGKGVSH